MKHAATLGPWALVALAGLALVACGQEAQRESPPRSAEPPPPAPAVAPPPPAEPAVEAEPAPGAMDRQQQAPPAAAAPESSAAPKSAPSPAKPASKRPEPTSGARRRAAEGATSDQLFHDEKSDLTPQVLRQRLDEIVKLSTPDCPSARSRKDAICSIASQICQLVDRDPEVASVETYCTDARQRCNDAEKRTAERCR